jgi:hypothetical protein
MSEGRRRRDDTEDDGGLNIVSGDDTDDAAGDVVVGDLFEAGQMCDACRRREGHIGLDPTCRGSYDGEPQLFCDDCAVAGLKDAWAGIEGIAAVVAPFGDYSAYYYYRLDEMPAYRFVRDDVEAVSWLLLTVGDTCSRCSEQSRIAWLGRDAVFRELPEDAPVFRSLDDATLICAGCAAAALAEACAALDLPLITVELPRGAMGVLMPTAE